MSSKVTQKDRILSPESRKAPKGIGPSQRSIPNLRKNDPKRSLGIRYVDDGMQPVMDTKKHIFQK